MIDRSIDRREPLSFLMMLGPYWFTLTDISNERCYHHLQQTGRQHYRLYAIHHLPKLKVLDFQRVKPSERATAQRWAQSAAGAALEKDLEEVKTFVPGESIEKRMFTSEEKEGIRQLLAQAATAQEVEEIENAVQRGVLPAQLQQEPAAKRQKVE